MILLGNVNGIIYRLCGRCWNFIKIGRSDSWQQQGENSMVYVILIIVFAFIWGFATDAVVRGKGYDSSGWFLWGFFFGIIAFIVALSKPENKEGKNNR